MTNSVFAAVSVLLAGQASSLSGSSDTDWVRWVLLDSQPILSTDGERVAIADETDVDAIEWYGGMAANRGDFFRSRGVATSGPEEYEYEEALQFEAADAKAHFWGKGIALNESLASMLLQAKIRDPTVHKAKHLGVTGWLPYVLS